MNRGIIKEYSERKLFDDQYIPIDPANIYIVQAYLDNSFDPQTNGSQGANAPAYFTLVKNLPRTYFYGTGLRVKTIKTSEPQSPPIIKSYKYWGR